MSMVWLHDNSLSANGKKMTQGILQKAGISPQRVFFTPLTRKVPRLATVKMGKSKAAKQEWALLRVEVQDALLEYASMVKATAVIVSDEKVLACLFGIGSLEKARGSVYFIGTLPVIIIGDPMMVPRSVTGAWRFVYELQKAARWELGKQRQEPKFNYQVAQTVEDLATIRRLADQAKIITKDIETSGRMISCDGMSFLLPDGTIQSWVIPFINTCKPRNLHWDTEEEEIIAWQTVKHVNSAAAPKCMMNGTYDCTYYLIYNVAPVNYFLDPMHMVHAVWQQAPKRLDVQTALFVDHSRYWKEDIKGDSDGDKGVLPITPEGLANYWRYNALDTHNTLLVAVNVLALLCQPGMKWAFDNYVKEIELQLGPAFMMTMHGLNAIPERLDHKVAQAKAVASAALQELKIMADDPEFNPGSGPQLAHLLYDILGAQLPSVVKAKLSGRKTDVLPTDEKTLELIKDQHPILSLFIDKLWEYKKAAANVSKFGSPYFLYKDRFLYKYSAAGTITWRFASSEHNLWCGTNAQNLPGPWREPYSADPGYLYVEIDYSQSDVYFVAFHSGDEDLIRNITDDRDTHSVHCEHFFKIPYADIVAGKKAKAAWVEDPLTGVRQVTKKVTHGGNYMMTAKTVFVQMGRAAVRAAAKALGVQNSENLADRDLVVVCEKLLQDYIPGLYKRMPKWHAEVKQGAMRSGGRATNAFGFTVNVLGDIAKDQGIQRQLVAFYGQSGTAGNINRTLVDITYHSSLIQRGMWLVTQTHDSLGFLVPCKDMKVAHEMIGEVIQIMEQPCTINGRTFYVPAEASIGITWSKKSAMDYRPDLTLEDIVLNEIEYDRKHYEGKSWTFLQRWGILPKVSTQKL